MSVHECPSCAMEVEKKYSVCPICGYEFPRQKGSHKWIAIFLALLFAWPILNLVIRFIKSILAHV